MKLRKKMQRIPIGIRLAVLTAAVLALSLGVFGAISMVAQGNQALDVAKRDAHYSAARLESLITAEMFHGHSNMTDTMSMLSTPESVESVMLVRHNGKVTFSTEPEQQSKTLAKSARECSGCHLEGGKPVLARMPDESRIWVDRQNLMANTIQPIYNRPRCYNAQCHVHSPQEKVLGVLHIRVPFRYVEEALARSRYWMTAIYVLLATAASLIVIVLIRRWVSRPVKELVKGTRRVAEGDMTHVIARREGELGELAHAFNRMQEKLLVSQRQLVMNEKLASVGKLAAGVAHEINNPLTGILAFAEDLLDEAEEDDPRREDYEVIRRETLRCREIVRNLLDFSRQEQLSVGKIEINDVVKKTVRLVEKLAKFQNISLTVELGDNLPQILGDAGQLQQVLLNLLVNASEAMPQSGEIKVISRIETDSKMICVDVIDNGKGISPESLEKIFEPFYSTKGGKTSGLGLAVSWGIVEQHGGKIEVESEQGKGTAFHVFLPVAFGG